MRSAHPYNTSNSLALFAEMGAAAAEFDLANRLVAPGAGGIFSAINLEGVGVLAA